MTSSNGNIFRVTGPLCGEFTGHQWIPSTKASDVSFDLRLNKRLSKQSWSWWFGTPSRSLWRHHYAMMHFVRYSMCHFCSEIWLLGCLSRNLDYQWDIILTPITQLREHKTTAVRIYFCDSEVASDTSVFMPETSQDCACMLEVQTLKERLTNPYFDRLWSTLVQKVSFNVCQRMYSYHMLNVLFSVHLTLVSCRLKELLWGYIMYQVCCQPFGLWCVYVDLLLGNAFCMYLSNMWNMWISLKLWI